MRRNLKWKFAHTVLERRTLCFSSYKNHKLKVKLWSVVARERKKRAIFVPFILSERKFFNVCVLSQCIVYWIRFQNAHTCTYQKTLLHTLFCCLFLKSSKTCVSFRIIRSNSGIFSIFIGVIHMLAERLVNKRFHWVLVASLLVSQSTKLDMRLVCTMNNHVLTVINMWK